MFEDYSSYKVPPELRFKMGGPGFGVDIGKAIAIYSKDMDGVERGEAIYYTDEGLHKLADRIHKYADQDISTWLLDV